MLSRISVIIPAYNCARFISATLDSVLQQTLRPHEIIVVNDGSTDDLDVALQPYMNHITLVQQSNGGAASARNNGVSVATGDLIAFLDGDDLLTERALEEQLACMVTTGADVVYGDCQFMGGNFNGVSFMSIFQSNGPVTVEAVLDRRCNVVVSVLAKRTALLRVGGFDQRLRRCEDFDMWVRMLAAGCTFAYHRNVVMLYRRQGQGKSSGELGNALAECKLYRRFLFLCKSPAQVRIVLNHITRLSLRSIMIRTKQAMPSAVRLAARSALVR